MEFLLKCKCGGTFELSAKTRRRVIYSCNQCNKQMPIRKANKETDNDRTNDQRST